MTRRTMTLLTREAILTAQDLAHEDVPVPEWGGTVRVRTLTGAERDALGAAMVDADGKPDLVGYRCRMVAASVVDEAGARLFSDADAAALGAKSASALDRVASAVERINGMGAEAVEAAEKN
jgi:hypothetical protein